MRISPEAEVVSGAVVAVLMTVSAAAGAASTMNSVPSPVDARRKRIETNPLLSGSAPPPEIGMQIRVPARHRAGQAKAGDFGASEKRRPPRPLDLLNEALKL